MFLDCGRPPPEWVCREFVAAFRFNPKSWDSVFDRPKKRRWWDKEVREAGIAGRKLRRRGVAIGDGFFERLGIELKTSAATARRRYYSSAGRGRSEGRFSKIIGAPRRDLGRECEVLIPLIDAYMDYASQKSGED